MAEPLSAEERERARGIAREIAGLSTESEPVEAWGHVDADVLAARALLDAEAEVARLRELLERAYPWFRASAVKRKGAVVQPLFDEIAAALQQENPHGA